MNRQRMIKNYILEKDWVIDVGGSANPIQHKNSIVYDLRDGNDIQKKYGFGMKFDVVVASHVLEHLWNFPRVFKNFKSMLKKHGRLIIVVPNAMSFRNFWNYTKGKEVGPDHTCAFRMSDIINLVESNGFYVWDYRFFNAGRIHWGKFSSEMILVCRRKDEKD